MAEVLAIETPGLGDRSYLVHNGSAVCRTTCNSSNAEKFSRRKPPANPTPHSRR